MNDNEKPTTQLAPATTLNRRQFLVGAGAAAATFTLIPAPLVRGAAANSKITFGLIGCGGRGQWIANLFTQHGGYALGAAADYFKEKTDAMTAKFQVSPDRCFNGLSGYQRLLELPLDAVVIESPPYFHPEQAAAAVAAGKHVYLAKPVAVDVPGCRTVEASGHKATAKKLCFQVDFQTRANASYQEAVRRVREGMIGPLVSADAAYHCGPTWGGMDAFLRQDPKNPEARLRAWGLDRGLSGDIITEQNIHALDVVTWFLDAAPVQAFGSGGKVRPYLGDCWDHFAVVYRFPNDVLVSFSSTQVGAAYDDILCRVYGQSGTADTHYFGEVWVHSKEDGFNGGRMANLYTDGAVGNIATFHRNITQGDCANPTVAPSVRSNLTAILGRTAAYRNAPVTWDQMMSANERWPLELKGLKA
jgi:predicted dehydrogenase